MGSGVKVVRIDSVYDEDFQKLLFGQEYRKDLGRHRTMYLYRGLPDESYELVTSLQRACKNKKERLEPIILNNFAKYASLEDATVGESVWSKMILGQHHGLPTRLLDWSRSPLVALHFAMTEGNLQDMDERDCVVWRINVSKMNHNLPDNYQRLSQKCHQDVFTIDMMNEMMKATSETGDIEEEAVLHRYDRDMNGQPRRCMVFLEPPTIDARIANQYSFFSVVPSNVTKAEDVFADCAEGAVTKYIINRKLRWRIRDMLDQANVNERIIYPGLDGIAKWMSRYYYVRDDIKNSEDAD